MNFFENRNTYANGNALAIPIAKHMMGVRYILIVKTYVKLRKIFFYNLVWRFKI